MNILPKQFGYRYEDKNFHIELCPKNQYSVKWTPEWLTVGVALEPQSGVHAIGNDKVIDYSVYPNTVALTPSGCDIFSESANGGKYLICAYSPEIYEEEVDKVKNLKEILGTRKTKIGSCEIINTVNSYITKYENSFLGTSKLLHQGFALQFLGLTFSSFSSIDPRSRKQIFSPKILKRVTDYIEQNLKEKIDISQLSNIAHMDYTSFIKSFKKATGKSPYSYVISTRLQKTKEMLREDNFSIADISYQCGFNSQSHMTRLFSKEYNTTPRKYRIDKISKEFSNTVLKDFQTHNR